MSPIIYRGEFIYAEFHEAYNFARSQGYLKDSAELCRKEKCNKVLMDIRGVTGTIGTWDRFRLAQSALQYYNRDVQMAIIYRVEEVNGFFENVVVNRGGNFRIFTDLAPACEWLGIEESAVVVK